MKPWHVLGGSGLLAGLLVAYIATRAAGPVAMSQYTELREGPLQEHLVTQAELLNQPVRVQHHYPGQVSPQVTRCINHGFAPTYLTTDPQINKVTCDNAGAW